VAQDRSHLTPTERLAIRDAMGNLATSFGARTGRRSASAIAEVTGTNENTVRAYLEGRRRPNVIFVREFARHAGVRALETFIKLGWLPPDEALAPDPVNVAESMASVAAMIGRLEPHVRRILDGSGTATPAPLAAAEGLLSDVDGADRFDVRLFSVVSGERYQAITNGCAEFTLKPGQAPMGPAALNSLARRVGMVWKPRPSDLQEHPQYWSVQWELRARTYPALHNSDLGQFTWQGEPGTSTWTEQPATTHLLVQDPFGGVSRADRTDGWYPPHGLTLVVVGARYSAGVAAGALAQALGWQFVPVRSDIEVTADGRLFPVAREPISGRVLAWSSVARYIEQRYKDGDPWRAVVLVRPSALGGAGGTDPFAVSLLRDTRARIVYARPAQAHLDWWATRQTGSSGSGLFEAGDWLARTGSELQAIEESISTRPPGHDLWLSAADPADRIEAARSAIPPAIMDAQARVAWTALLWLDEVANMGHPSMVSRLLPGQLATWLPTLAKDPDARVTQQAAAWCPRPCGPD
jgi:hypothetical protein